MASNVVRVSLLADAQKFKAGLNEADRAVGKTEKTLSDFGKAAVAGLAVGAAGAVVSFAAKAVDAASNLEESMNAINVVFGEASGAIHKLGDDSVESFGLSERAFNEFATQFSAFAEQISKSSGRDVADIVEEMTTRVADFASVMNLDMAEAATIFQSGLAGETEAFRRFGVDVSAAAVQQKALEMGLKDTSAQLTEQDKILARYELIMDQTDKTAGDFQATQDSLANSQRMLNASWEDAQAKLGGMLVPAVAEATASLNDMLVIGSALVDKFGELGGEDSGVVGAFVGGLIKLVPFVGQVTDGWRVASEALSLGADAIKDASGETFELERRLDSSIPVVEEMTASQLDLGREVDNTRASMRELFDVIDGRLDTFGNYTQAVDDQAAAQSAVNDAIAEFGDGSAEHLKTLEDLAGANRDVKDAELQVVDAGGLTRQEFIKQQTELGLTIDQANLLADKYNLLFTPRSVTNTINIREVRDTNARTGRAGGGGVQRGVPVTVGEFGPETFVPGSDGNIISHGARSQAGSNGHGTVINLSVQALDPAAAARAVVQALQAYERQNGAIPIITRSP